MLLESMAAMVVLAGAGQVEVELVEPQPKAAMESFIFFTRSKQ
jgi:hypothetical protein